MRVFVAVTGIILLVVVASFTYLYFAWGLGSYFQTAYSIEQLPAEQKQKARDYFYYWDGTVYRGTVARVDTDGYGSVWIWGSRGLKHFLADKDSVFSFYETCGLKNMDYISIDDRNIYTDIDSWNKEVQKGYLVEAHISTSTFKDRIGSLREIYAYDSWWPFKPVILSEICGN